MKQLQQKKLRNIGSQRPPLYRLVKRRSLFVTVADPFLTIRKKLFLHNVVNPTRSLSIPLLKVYIILWGSGTTIFNYPISTVLPSKAKPYLYIFSTGTPFSIRSASYFFSSICASAAATVSSSVCSFFVLCTLNSII